ERAPNGYRKYTEEHLGYLECIWKMNTGFGMSLIRKIMPLIRAGESIDARWLVNDVKVDLHQEKRRVEQVLHALEREELEKVSTNRKKEWYTIGEAAKEVDVASSAIRHWEKEGLITPVRNQESGYRNYSAA